MTIHKSNSRNRTPAVSIILLDWSVREKFQALEWLTRQNAPRESYELIWVELYDRVVPQAMESADVLITCQQRGMYHKHCGYNRGLLAARGKIVTICDSDAVFTPDYVESILEFFALDQVHSPRSAVLMHHEWRTECTYPENLKDPKEELPRYRWLDLWPNVGASLSVPKIDAIRFGGFDEHRSYRGLLCGPYELGWRMVNAGIEEIWHDPTVALWHFAHPHPVNAYGMSFSLRHWREITHPHIAHHALTAVEAFSTGRLLPLRENHEIFKLRMDLRNIGSSYERHFAFQTGPEGFSRKRRWRLYLALWIELAVRSFHGIFRRRREYAGTLARLLGKKKYESIRSWWLASG